MSTYEMTLERRRDIIKIIQWYWHITLFEDNPFISNSDYKFLQEIWMNGLGIYDDDIQTRLNKIKEIYNNNSLAWRKKMKNGFKGW
jgi:hypothetical protein